MKNYRIATIAGDGIGTEVVPEGIRVLDAAARRDGFRLTWDQLPWSCSYYRETGRMMPEGALEQIRGHDAIFLGAVGFPGVPDHISLDRKSTRLNSSHLGISYAVFCLKK